MKIASIALAALLTAAGPGVAQSARPGAAAIDFRLKALAGGTVTLAEYRGRPLLLNFWATWCKPCRAEMTDIIAAYNAHRDQDLQVLAINLTDQERMKDVRAFLREVQMPFPVLLDEKGKVRRGYALRGVPTSVFIDANGIMRIVNAGPISREAIERGLAEILPAR